MRARRRSTGRRRSRRRRRHASLAEGGEPPAHGLVQDPRRRQQARRRSASAERAAGVVAASAGNHGQAVAWAARELGIAATVFMPQDAPMAKVEATRNYGAETVLTGAMFDDALAEAMARAEDTGATFVHAFEDRGRDRRAGHDRSRARRAAAGGGDVRPADRRRRSLRGIAIALRALRPGVRIVGVQAGEDRAGHDRRRHPGQASRRR